MIKNITGTGKYIQVTEVVASNYVNNHIALQGVGNVRFNTYNQTMEMYDGNIWATLNMSQANVSLNLEAEELLDWARQKRQEELEYKYLSETNPAVKIALDNLKKAKKQLDVTIILSKEHETTS